MYIHQSIPNAAYIITLDRAGMGQLIDLDGKRFWSYDELHKLDRVLSLKGLRRVGKIPTKIEVVVQ